MFDFRKALPTDANATPSPHVLRAWLVFQLSTFQQVANKGMKKVQRRYSNNEESQGTKTD